MTVVRVSGDNSSPIRLRLAQSPAAMRMRLGGVEAMRLRFQSGQPGPQGPQGVQGEQGIQGIQGATGPQGSPGYTNYLDARDYGVTGDGVADDTAELQALFNAEDPTYSPGVTEPFRRTATTCFIPNGTYKITSPLSLPAGVSVILDQGATIIAGSAMVSLLTTPEATANDQHNNSFIIGGIWDCNDLADSAFWLKYFAKFTLADLQTNGALDYHIRMGSDSAPSSSYEGFIRNVLCRRKLTAFPTDVVGIHFENAGDCHVSDVVIMGVKYGINGEVYDSKFDRVHTWNATEHGNLSAGIAITGSENIFTQCQVDAPLVNGGSAFYFISPRNSVIGCSLNHFGSDLQVQAIFLETGAHTVVIGCTWKGASGAARIATDVNGDISGSTILANHTSNVNAVVGDRLVTALKIGGNQVVGARDTGWAAMTGTANENTVYAVGSVTLPQLAGRVAAIQAALTAHGLIGT